MSLSIPSAVLLLLLLAGSTTARSPHLITFRSNGLAPASLAWDPSAQHFLVGSLSTPTVSSVSDAGVVETLVNDGDLLLNSSFLAVTLDATRRRLLVAVTHPYSSSIPQIAAFDLKSPRPHRRIFLSDLPSEGHFRPSDVAVEPSTGAAFVAAAESNLVWRVDAEGEVLAFSRSKIFGAGDGLDGIVHDPKGYFLAMQRSTGKLFKVDPDDGIARLVLLNKDIPGGEGVAMRSDGSAVVVGGHSAWILRSDDSWGEAAVFDVIDLGEGRQARGVAIREGRRVYVLHGVEEGSADGGVWRIEEVESERETSGEWVGAMVMVGLGLAVFMYWRFQMRQLVTNMNKKSA